jgi:single-strand DNA-binding protein
MNNISNNVRLIGRLGTDPKVRSFGNNKKVAHFSIATNETYKDTKGNKVTNTCWHNIVAWNNQARFSEQYLHKGQEIAIEGKLSNRTYTDKNGNTKYMSEVIVQEIRLLGKASASVLKD